MSITTAPSGPVTSECGPRRECARCRRGRGFFVSSPSVNVTVPSSTQAQLLIRMLVLRHDRAGVELDDGQGQLLAADDAPVDAVEDPLQVELLHGWQVPGSVHPTTTLPPPRLNRPAAIQHVQACGARGVRPLEGRFGWVAAHQPPESRLPSGL